MDTQETRANQDIRVEQAVREEAQAVVEDINNNTQKCKKCSAEKKEASIQVDESQLWECRHQGHSRGEIVAKILRLKKN